jgi:hypothetical protein
MNPFTALKNLSPFHFISLFIFNCYEITSLCSERAVMFVFSVHGRCTVLGKKMEKGNFTYEVKFIKITTRCCLEEKITTT